MERNSVRFITFVMVLFICIRVPGSGQETGAVRFLAHFEPPEQGSYISGCWGWTDSLTDREYALLGSHTGTTIVEITDIDSIVVRDFVQGPSSIWREIQAHSHYAYVVSEGGSGTQIIDLSFLPDSVHLVQNFVHTDSLSNKSSVRSHSVHVKDGFLYLNGSASWQPGGILIFSLDDPESPRYVGKYESTYVHDSFVRNDTIFAACLGSGVHIVDATDKSRPKFISRIAYTGSGTHNAATTTDGRYLLTTDEIGSTPKTMKVWDVSDPVNWQFVAEYQGDPNAIVHNVFVRGDLAIMSYYTAGMKVVDVSNPLDPREIGGYDTYQGTGGGFDGAWSVYPFFPSGKIIIGDMESGLYVVDIPGIPVNVSEEDESSVPKRFALGQSFPNPFNGSTTMEVHLPADGYVSVKVYDILGREVRTLTDGYSSAGSLSLAWHAYSSRQIDAPSGVYMILARFVSADGQRRFQDSKRVVLTR